MKNADLVDAWRKCSFDRTPYILPGDREALLQEKAKRHIIVHESFQGFTESSDFGLKSDKRLHLGILPAPFRGDLSNSSVFILLLNPGLSPADYFGEFEVDEFRQSLLRNLRQENTDDEYPFVSLDPQFSWHSSGVYWQKKLHGIVESLVKPKFSYHQALKHVARNVACIQFVPYHSKSFGLPSSIHERLQSSQAAVRYVNQVVVPKVIAGKATIIAARKVDYWKLQKHENIIPFEGTETRAAHMTPGSRAGDAIISQLRRLL